MAKKLLEELELIDLTKGKKQPFVRKVIVVAYYLKETKSGKKTPYFLFTVIAPKQPEKVTRSWKKANHFRLPSGFSLIKGTREMYKDGDEQDIPPGFGRYFRKLISGSLKKRQVDDRVDGVIPAIISALTESKEEGGIKLHNVELIFDLGVRKAKIDGENLRFHGFAIELKRPVNAKAKDSLALEYFSLKELKLAAKIRTRFNIPLVRPSHAGYVEDVYEVLNQQYGSYGTALSKKGPSQKKVNKSNSDRATIFKGLIKNAGQGRFKAYKHTTKETIKNIIEKSIISRAKQRKS